jgi:hypothetical protein
MRDHSFLVVTHKYSRLVAIGGENIKMMFSSHQPLSVHYSRPWQAQSVFNISSNAYRNVITFYHAVDNLGAGLNRKCSFSQSPESFGK